MASSVRLGDEFTQWYGWSRARAFFMQDRKIFAGFKKNFHTTLFEILSGLKFKFTALIL